MTLRPWGGRALPSSQTESHPPQVKCEHYWPLDAQPCTHGQLRVTLVAEEVTENWAVRDLQLLHVSSPALHLPDGRAGYPDQACR